MQCHCEQSDGDCAYGCACGGPTPSATENVGKRSFTAVRPLNSNITCELKQLHTRWQNGNGSTELHTVRRIPGSTKMLHIRLHHLTTIQPSDTFISTRFTITLL